MEIGCDFLQCVYCVYCVYVRCPKLSEFRLKLRSRHRGEEPKTGTGQRHRIELCGMYSLSHTLKLSQVILHLQTISNWVWLSSYTPQGSKILDVNMLWHLRIGCVSEWFRFSVCFVFSWSSEALGSSQFAFRVPSHLVLQRDCFWDLSSTPESKLWQTVTSCDKVWQGHIQAEQLK